MPGPIDFDADGSDDGRLTRPERITSRNSTIPRVIPARKCTVSAEPKSVEACRLQFDSNARRTCVIHSGSRGSRLQRGRADVAAIRQSNRLDTDSSAAVRPIASPISVAIGSTRMLRGAAHRFGRLDRVGDDQFLEPRAGDARDRAARQHAVGDVGVDVGRALLRAARRRRSPACRRNRRCRRPGCRCGPRPRRSRSSPRIRRRARAACR